MEPYIPQRLSLWPTEGLIHTSEPSYPPPGEKYDLALPEHRVQMGEFAVQMARWGWVLVPLQGKVPTSTNWQNQTDVQTALTSVLDKLKSGSANNVGVVTGAASKLMVVDIDQTAWTKKGLVHSGYTIWNYLEQKYGPFNTLQVRTGKGGLHVYFEYSSFLNTSALSESKNSFISGYGLDFRSTGGQVVCPLSIHPLTKHKYTIINAPVNSAGVPILIPMPAWLMQLISTGDLSQI